MIKEVNIDDVFNSIQNLFIEHREEVTTHKHIMILNPDMDKYRKLEEQGVLLILAAYAEDKLVGYSVNFINNNLHYADLRMCTNDLLFVKKEYRNSSIGFKLIKETERMARERGAGIILWHAKEKTSLSVMLPGIGYGIQDIVFSKEL